jgi:hypothetical protein
MIVEYEFLPYVNIVICIGPYPILETWPPIYRGQERAMEGRLKGSQVEHPSLLLTHTYFN